MSLVSLIIPTCNRSSELRKLLRSAGDIENYEIVVVDDNSESAHALANEQFARTFGNVQYRKNEVRRGAPYSRNLGAGIASGEYLWFFDDDDMMQRSAFCDVIERLEVERPRFVLLGLKIVRGATTVAQYEPSVTRDNYDAYRDRGQLVNTTAVIVDRALFETAGGWDPELVAAQDTDLILRLSRLARPDCWGSLYVLVNVGLATRITNHVWRQQYAKLQMLRKHWKAFTWRRRAYYLVTFLLMRPLWRRLSGRVVSRELTS